MPRYKCADLYTSCCRFKYNQFLGNGILNTVMWPHFLGQTLKMRSALNKADGYTRIDKHSLDSTKKAQKRANSKRWHVNICLVGYVLTAVLQTSLVDYLRVHDALGRKALLLPTLANTIGMALCGLLMGSHKWRLGVTRVTSSLQLRRLVLAGVSDSIISKAR